MASSPRGPSAGRGRREGGSLLRGWLERLDLVVESLSVSPGEALGVGALSLGEEWAWPPPEPPARPGCPAPAP